MKSSTLKRIYKKYNRKYFDNQLPFHADIKFADIGDDVFGLSAPWNYEIELHKELTDTQIRGTLLHECCHFEQYFVFDDELEDESSHHTISFYFRAIELYQLTGYPVA